MASIALSHVRIGNIKSISSPQIIAADVCSLSSSSKPNSDPLGKNEIDIPDYEIQRSISEGGMSKVFLAVHKPLQRTVALKVMKPELAAAEGLAKRFFREGQIIADLNHPHIATVFDIGVHDHHHYLSMEYLPGGDLKQAIQRGLPFERTLQIIKTIAGALGFAHKRSIVHRDIKPQNIVFRDENTPILTDFGIAKVLGECDTALTSSGWVLGSPRYMSPEQAIGDDVDSRTDLYSLGILFYEMLTGRPPFESGNRSALAMHLEKSIPALPKEFAALQPILDKLTANKPNERFKSAEDFIAALEQAESKLSHSRDPVNRVLKLRTNFKLRVKDLNLRDWPEALPSWKAWSSIIGLLGVLSIGSIVATSPEASAKKESGLEAMPSSGPMVSDADKNIPTRDSLPTKSGIQSPQFSMPEEIWMPNDTEKEINSKPDEADFLPEQNGNLQKEFSGEPVIDELLIRSRRQLASKHLTTPRSNNAFDTYKQVLVLDSRNEEALAGLEKIVKLYRYLAEDKIRARQLQNGLIFIDRGLLVADYIERRFGISSSAADLRALRPLVQDLAQKEIPEQKVEQLYARVKKLMHEAKMMRDLRLKHDKVKEILVLVKKGLEMAPRHDGMEKLRFEAWSLDSELRSKIE